MKKRVAFLLVLAVLLSLLSLSGCGNGEKLKDAEIATGVFIQYDKKYASVDGQTIRSANDDWYMVIHVCNTIDDLHSRETYFENSLKSIAYTDIEAEEKTFGAYTYQTEYHTSNNQFAGSFFTRFDDSVTLTEKGIEIYGIYCYVWLEDPDLKPSVEGIMSSLEIHQ